MNRYKDNIGNIHKLDSGVNHFINGKCVNPKSWEDLEIGSTFYPNDVGEAPINEELVITGHVSNFEYYDHDKKEVVYVDTSV